MDVQIEASWKELLASEFSQAYFQQIVQHLKTERQQGKRIYPPGPFIFNAFNSTPVDQVKVVVLGQDPYHGLGQAHGLCFSVQRGVPAPPSLVNIFKELKADIGLETPTHGDLSAWARQGVFLLNASLTVRAAEPMSHAKIGWARFTDTVIQKLAQEQKNLVFLLWGKFAQEKAALIDANEHQILRAAHPSPLSAHNGFFGCRHFSKTNEYLIQTGRKPIDWSI